MTAQPDYDDTNAQHCDTNNAAPRQLQKACCFFVSFGPSTRTDLEYFKFPLTTYLLKRTNISVQGPPLQHTGYPPLGAELMFRDHEYQPADDS